MNKLWAPWRASYIYIRKQKVCIFCANHKGRDHFKNYVLQTTKYSMAMLNIFPYNNGHIMVSPKRHVKSLKSLRDEEILDLMKLLNLYESKLEKLLKPDGFNIGINMGKVGGAGFAGHVHIHIVPRFIGDANFMPILSDTKVISESLDSLYKRLKNVDKA